MSIKEGTEGRADDVMPEGKYGWNFPLDGQSCLSAPKRRDDVMLQTMKYCHQLTAAIEDDSPKPHSDASEMTGIIYEHYQENQAELEIHLMESGEQALKDGNYEDAIKFFSEAEKMEVRDAQLYKGVAMVLVEGSNKFTGLHEIAEAALRSLDRRHLHVLYENLQKCHHQKLFKVPKRKNREMDELKIGQYLFNFIEAKEQWQIGKTAGTIFWALQMYFGTEEEK